MRLIELAQKTNWAIMPEKLDAIHQVLFNHLHGYKIDLTALEAQIGRKLENSYDATVTESGLAIIPVFGVLAKRMNLFMEISGGSSSELIARDFRLALEDDDVNAILLHIDSPGGTVDGTEALADLIFESRGIKPIIAFANGLMASAAYWIGSSADYIITENTGEVGSIGVFQVHYDYSKADEMAGIKRTFLYAGKYKTMGNNAEPLSREAEDYLKAGVDYMYTIFVDTVARNRGVSSETVLEDMADGRLFIGQQAVDAGMVDELGSFEIAVETALQMAEMPEGQYVYINKGAITPEKKEEKQMLNKKTDKENAPVTIEMLDAQYPEITAQLRTEGAETVNIQEAVDSAISSEKERILELASAQFGEEAGESFRAIVDSNVTVEQFKAIRGSASKTGNEEFKTEMLNAIKKAGAENPGSGDQTKPGDGQDFMSMVTAHMQTNGCSKAKAIQDVAKSNPKAHQTWVMEQQGGTVH